MRHDRTGRKNLQAAEATGSGLSFAAANLAVRQAIRAAARFASACRSALANMLTSDEALAKAFTDLLDRAQREAREEVSTASIARARLVTALADIMVEALKNKDAPYEPDEHPAVIAAGVRQMLASGATLRPGGVYLKNGVGPMIANKGV